MAVLVFLAMFLALSGHSSANYCLCKDGVGEQALQKALDYACGAGADCTAISQNGACYQPNTVKDHCSYAVNSYFQKKGQATGSCEFNGAASPSTSPPTGVTSTCVFPASPGNAGTSPTTNPGSSTPGSSTGTGTGTSTGTGTGTSTGTGSTGTSTGTGTGGTSTGNGTGGMGTGTGTGTSTGMNPGSSSTGTGTTPSVFGTGLGPTGSGTGMGDTSGSTSTTMDSSNLFFLVAAGLMMVLLV
ncbi:PLASMODESMATA CALLOSE-BINDING PROTEIN 3 [Linum grandiflorum]